MKTDLSVVVQVTERCNLSCKYCHLDKYRAKRDITRATAEKLMYELLNYNDRFGHFTWAGGEPLLIDDSFFADIAEYSKNHNQKSLDISHSIQTNGVLLTLERKKRLQSYGYKLGGSFDGCLDVQEKVRVTSNKNLSDQIVQNLTNGQKDMGLITVLTSELIGREEEVYANLKKMTARARINSYAPSGSGLAEAATLLPSVDDAAKSMLKFYDMWRTDTSDIILNPFSSIVRGFITGWVKTCDYSAYSCARILGVNPVGDVFLCSRSTHFPETKLGNINETTLEELIGNQVHQKVLDRYFALKEGDCKGCEWLSVCSGGCPIEAQSFAGDFNKKTYYCEARKAVFKKIDEDLKNDGNQIFAKKTRVFQ